MRVFILSVLLGAVCFGAQIPQQSAPEPSKEPSDKPIVRKLRVLETKVSANSPSHGYRGNMRCDAGGNVYFQVFEGGSLQRNVVAKFSRDGVVSRVALDKLPELHNPDGVEFSISPTGELHFLYYDREPKKKPRLTAAVFDADLHFKTKIAFEEGYSPRHFAVFPTGEILVDGRYYRKLPDGNQTYGPYTALFDSSGRKLKDITFEADFPLKRAAAAFQKDKPTEPFGASGEWGPIDLGSALTGEDGLVYVMRRDDPAIFYALSAAGEIVNRFDVDAPAPGMMPVRFQLSQNQLAVEYYDFNGNRADGYIKIVNARTGENISLLDLAGTKSGMACFTAPGRFSFLTSDKSKMAVVTAEPEN